MKHQGLYIYSDVNLIPISPKERNRKDYMSCHGRDWEVADLNQLVRTGRGRTETVEGHLPTLTTNSGKLWSKVQTGLWQRLLFVSK